MLAREDTICNAYWHIIVVGLSTTKIQTLESAILHFENINFRAEKVNNSKYLVPIIHFMAVNKLVKHIFYDKNVKYRQITLIFISVEGGYSLSETEINLQKTILSACITVFNLSLPLDDHLLDPWCSLMFWGRFEISWSWLLVSKACGFSFSSAFCFGEISGLFSVNRCCLDNFLTVFGRWVRIEVFLKPGTKRHLVFFAKNFTL